MEGPAAAGTNSRALCALKIPAREIPKDLSVALQNDTTDVSETRLDDELRESRRPIRKCRLVRPSMKIPITSRNPF